MIPARLPQRNARNRPMTSTALLASALALAVPGTGLSACSGPVAAPAAVADTAQARTAAVVAAADAFLATLDAGQRGKVQFDFDPHQAPAAARFARSPPPGGRPPGGPDEPPAGPGPGPGAKDGGDAHAAAGNGHPPGGPAGGGPGMGPGGDFVGERYGQAVWSNYPVSDVPRPGLALGSLDATQRAAAMHLLQTLLSPQGYRKVLDIMGSDQALSETGTHFASGTDQYTLSLFGQPGSDAPWMVQFGGHHLGLNVVIAGEHGVLTPTLTGAQPSVYKAEGRTVRVLAGENDKAFALLDALDEDQRKQAILDYRVDDLVLGPGHSGETIVPEGLQASRMNADQRKRLLAVVAEWAGIVDAAYAQPRMAQIEADLDQTWFAWSGPTTHAPDRNAAPTTASRARTC
jgi:hypothetical protein